MKKAFFIIGGTAVAAMLLLPLFLGSANARDYLAGVAITAFGIAVLSLCLGVLLLLISIGVKEVLPYAKVSFIVGGVILLFSFTLCSSGAVRIL